MYTREELLAEKARRASLNNPDSQSGLERQGKNLLIGYANLGHNVLNLPHNVAGMFSDELASKIPYQQEQDFAKIVGQERKSPVDVLMQGIGEYGPSLAIPGANLGKLGSAIGAIPKAGGALKAGISLGLPQGAYTLANEIGAGRTDEALANAATTTAMTAPFGAFAHMAGQAPSIVKNAGRIGLAGGGAYAGNELGDLTGLPFAGELAALGGAIIGGRGINVNKNARKTVFDGLNPDEAKKIVEASRRLGLDFVTPGEAFENPFVAQELARVGKTREGSRELYQAGKQRAESESKSIEKLLGDIFNEGLTPEKQRLYKTSLETFVPNESIGKFVQSSTIGNAVKGLSKDPIYKDLLRENNYNPNTIGYWNQVKRVLDGMYSKTKDNTKKGIIDSARKELVGELDSLDVNYPEARSIAEREIQVRDLKKHFNKTDLTGNRFSKLLEDKEKFNKLRGKLNAFPDVQARLDDMLLVFPRLQNFNPTNKTTAALERTGMSTARNPIDSVRDYLQRNLYQGEDIEAVKLMASPKWLEELTAYNAAGGDVAKAEKLMKDPEMLSAALKSGKMTPQNQAIAKILEMLGKGAGQYAGEGEQND